MYKTVVIDGDISLSNVVDENDVDYQQIFIDGDISLSNVVDGENGIVYQQISIDGDIYNGDYAVTPKVVSQTLRTENKVMLHNVTVFEIPYFETSNQSGYTVYIGNEV